MCFPFQIAETPNTHVRTDANFSGKDGELPKKSAGHVHPGEPAPRTERAHS